MTTRKYNRNKRPGSKPVQTKRTSKNQHQGEQGNPHKPNLLHSQKKVKKTPINGAVIVSNLLRLVTIKLSHNADTKILWLTLVS